MSESRTIRPDAEPLTVASLREQLHAAGVQQGQTVIVHSSLRALGWTCGGPVAAIEALIGALGPEGTLVMPAHTGGNSEPSHWQNPPVPSAWWPTIRAHMPPFDPAVTPTRGMGAIAELFRTWPGTRRSAHPLVSFAARGPEAERIVRDHDLEDMLGDASPLGRLYELDAWILLLGVGHESNTSLHLAEARAGDAVAPWMDEGTAMTVDGRRAWVRFRHRTPESDDFPSLGTEYEKIRGVPVHRVGAARTRLLRMRPLVDFGVDWLRRHRR